MNKNPTKYFGNELKYLKKVLNSESWAATAGSWNNQLERYFCEISEAKYAIALNSGTSTLHACLEACGVGEGDEVISPALTVIMDTTATLHANAIPVYADVDPDTFNIDPKDIRKKITSRTKAIIVVSLYGLPCEMDEIMEIASENNLVVVEDNAQCFLSKYKGKKTGTIGHMASYSFENTKHISCGEGGIIITNDEQLAEKTRKIGGHGFKNLRAEEGRIKLNQNVFQDPDYKRHDVLGWNYRLSEFNAAVALAQLENWEHLVNLRVESARIFLDAVADCDFLVPQKTPEWCENSYYTLGVKYEGKKKLGVSWQDFRQRYVDLGGDGIYAAWAVPYFEPVVENLQFKYRNHSSYASLKYERGLCPVAESIQPEMMQFKTNYRDLNLAKQKAEILREAIRYYK